MVKFHKKGGLFDHRKLWRVFSWDILVRLLWDAVNWTMSYHFSINSLFQPLSFYHMGELSLKQSSRSAVRSEPTLVYLDTLVQEMKLVCLSVSSPLTSPSPRWDKNKWFWWRGQSKSGLYRVDSNFRPFYLAPYTSSIWVVIFLSEEFCFLYALFCTNWKLSFLQEL